MDTTQIPFQEISLEHLVSKLETAGIDNDGANSNDATIYVNGLAFPIWLRLDEEDHSLLLQTHWPFTESTSRDEALSFANHLNCSKLMVQFSLPDPGTTLWGHYWQSYRRGLCVPTLLRHIHRFAGCFAEAVNEGRSHDLLPARIEPQEERMLH